MVAASTHLHVSHGEISSDCFHNSESLCHSMAAECDCA